jgi:hypothetical protein
MGTLEEICMMDSVFFVALARYCPVSERKDVAKQGHRIEPTSARNTIII